MNKKPNKKSFDPMDSFEKELINTLENEEWESVQDLEKAKKILSGKIKNTMFKKPKLKRQAITLRLVTDDIDLIKKKATLEGIPYQTLIGSILHKFAIKALGEIKTAS